MPRPKGLPKTGGRQKGTPNRKTLDARESLAVFGTDPVELACLIAMDKLPCSRCGDGAFDRNITNILRDDNGRCVNCKGTGYKILADNEQSKMILTLVDRVLPKLASKTVDKTVRRFVMARMNALSAEDRAEIERKAQEDGEE